MNAYKKVGNTSQKFDIAGYRIFGSIVLFLLAMTLLALTASEARGQILVNYNGDFELFDVGVISEEDVLNTSVDGDNLHGWSFRDRDRHAGQTDPDADSRATFEVVDSPVYSGSRAMKIDILNSQDGPLHFIQLGNEDIPVLSDGIYRVSFMAKSKKPGGSFFLSYQYYRDFHQLALFGHVGSQTVPHLTDEWQRYVFQFHATEYYDEVWTRAAINLNFPDNEGNTLYFDDLQVVELAGPPEPVEPGEPVNRNGGFEMAFVGDGPGDILGWEFKGPADFIIVDDPVFYGDKALRISIDEAPENPWNLESIMNNIPVKPGVTYDFSMWAKADRQGTIIRPIVTNQRNEWYGAQSTELSLDWQEINFTLTIDDNETAARIAIQLGYEENNDATIFIDEVHIAEFIIDPGTPINVNAGFEDSPPVHTPADSINGWSFNGHEENLATFQTVSEPVYEGESALEIDISGIGEVPWSVEAASENIPVTPGYTYQLTAMVRSAVPGATINVWVQDLEFSAYARVGSDDLTLTTDWQMLYTEFTVGDDTEYVRVPFHMGLDENIGNKIYLDNVIVSQITEDGEPTASDPSAPENRHELPESMTLHQNYPNPFNPATQIRFDLAEPGQVTLTVYDMLGQRVATLADNPMSAGQHEVTFDATGLSSGIYLYRLSSGNQTLTRSMLLIK